MEPVFMVLGQSAATAAVHAIEANQAVQDISYERLQQRLLADQQVLAWTGPKKTGPKPGLDPTKLPGIVVDEEDAELRGFSMTGHTVSPYVGPGYRHDGDADKGHQVARYSVRVEKSGRYEVRLGYSAFSNRASNVPVLVRHADGEEKIVVNQQKVAAIDKLFQPLGTFRFQAGETYDVTVSNEGTNGHVILDAIQLVLVGN